MKISVITVCYNAINLIEDTLKSVIEQKYDSFEYIVIDGSSNDGTLQVIERYRDKIDYLVSEPDNGIYQAMNKGVGLATGEYCLFMNAGDKFANNGVLSNVSKYLNGLDYYAGNTICTKRNNIIGYFRSPQKVSKEYFIQNSLSHQSSFIKRTMLLEYPYDEKLRMVSDWKFCILTLILEKRTYKAINVDVSLYDCEGITETNKDRGSIEVQLVLNDFWGSHVHRRKYNIIERINSFIIRKFNLYAYKISRI